MHSYAHSLFYDGSASNTSWLEAGQSLFRVWRCHTERKTIRCISWTHGVIGAFSKCLSIWHTINSQLYIAQDGSIYTHIIVPVCTKQNKLHSTVYYAEVVLHDYHVVGLYSYILFLCAYGDSCDSKFLRVVWVQPIYVMLQILITEHHRNKVSCKRER